MQINTSKKRIEKGTFTQGTAFHSSVLKAQFIQFIISRLSNSLAPHRAIKPSPSDADLKPVGGHRAFLRAPAVDTARGLNAGLSGSLFRGFSRLVAVSGQQHAKTSV